MPKLSEKSTYVSAFQSYSGPRGVNFEQYLAPAFSAAIGPLVALGSPEDYAAPDGAARMYAADTDWKDQFRILARRSACIVMRVDQSDNLGWELESIRTDRLQEKFLVLVSPQKKAGSFCEERPRVRCKASRSHTDHVVAIRSSITIPRIHLGHHRSGAGRGDWVRLRRERKVVVHGSQRTCRFRRCS